MKKTEKIGNGFDQIVDILIETGIVPEQFRKLVIIKNGNHLPLCEAFTGVGCIQDSYQSNECWIVTI